MAFSAINFFMFPFKFISREVMVKIVLIKTDHIEFTAMMITMAFKTILFLYRLFRMIPTIFIDQGLNFGMAFQTFFIGNLVTQVMALSTIAHPFQFGMGFG